MKTIVLNPSLEPVPSNEHRRGNPEQLMQTIMNKVGGPECGHNGPKKLMPVIGFSGEPYLWTKSFLNMTSTAYSQHYGLVIAPHDMWYIVLTEIATFIKGNTEAMRHFFTNSTEKQELLVETADPYVLPMKAILEQLKQRCPININLMLPVCSTDTPDTEFAYATAVADGVQQYYDYGMFCCGLPQVKILGTPADWKNLYKHASELSATFADGKAPGQLTIYLARVAALFMKIAYSIEVATEQDAQEFWQDLFRQKNVGSGGDLIVNGWIVDLFINNKKDQLIKSFPHTISVVPYRNHTTGKDYKLMLGSFKGHLYADNFLAAQFDYCVAEVVDKEPKPGSLDAAIAMAYSMMQE